MKFADDPTGFKVRPSATRQDNCVMVGVDPDAALGGDNPLFKFQFVEGTRDEAIARLKRGRLLPRARPLRPGIRPGRGREVPRDPPEDPDEPVEYEIAGVVSMPGWHWMTKRHSAAAGPRA